MTPENFYNALIELISPRIGENRAAEIALSAKILLESILQKNGEELVKFNQLMRGLYSWLADYQQQYLLNNLSLLQSNFENELRPFMVNEADLTKLVKKIMEHVKTGVEKQEHSSVPDLIVKDVLEIVGIKEFQEKGKDLDSGIRYLNLKYDIDNKVNNLLEVYKTPNALECQEIVEEIDQLIETALEPAKYLIEEQSEAAEIIEERIKLFISDKMDFYARSNLLTDGDIYRLKLAEVIQVAKELFPNSDLVVDYAGIQNEFKLIHALKGLTNAMGLVIDAIASKNEFEIAYKENPEKFRKEWLTQLFGIIKSSKQLNLEALADAEFKFIEHEHKENAEKLRRLFLGMPREMLSVFRQQSADFFQDEERLNEFGFESFMPTWEMQSVLKSPNLGFVGSYLSEHERIGVKIAKEITLLGRVLSQSGSPVHSPRSTPMSEVKVELDGPAMTRGCR